MHVVISPTTGNLSGLGWNVQLLNSEAGSNPTQLCGTGSDRAINILLKLQGATLKLATFWGWLIMLKPNMVYCLFTSADSPVSPKKYVPGRAARAQTCLARMLPFSTSHASSLCEEASILKHGWFQMCERLFCEGRWPASFSALFYMEGKKKKTSMDHNTTDIWKEP